MTPREKEELKHRIEKKEGTSALGNEIGKGPERESIARVGSLPIG